MKKIIINTFCPKSMHKFSADLVNIESLSNLLKNPVKWVKKNYGIIRKLLQRSRNFFFSNPKLKWADENVEGFLSFVQGKTLYKLAKKLPEESVIVEIGAYLGRSTFFISEAIKKKDIKFYSIDTFENQGMSEGLRDTFKEYYKNIYYFRNKIKIIKGFSYDVVKNLKDLKIDFLWLDADHQYNPCKKDIEDWLPLVRENGLIAFHDYYERKGNHRVKKAVDEKIREKKLKKMKYIEHLLVTKKIR